MDVTPTRSLSVYIYDSWPMFWNRVVSTFIGTELEIFGTALSLILMLVSLIARLVDLEFFSSNFHCVDVVHDSDFLTMKPLQKSFHMVLFVSRNNFYRSMLPQGYNSISYSPGIGSLGK